MEVHTLEKLELKAPEGKRLVVLGDPVAHSLSPVMHNSALRELARSWPELADWHYEAVHVPAAELGTALTLLHAAGVVGINLTIPHKVDVLEILEDIDPIAREMGAVNTLIRTPSGYRGSNTDGYGILKGIEENFQCTPIGADIWLFGAGGAARGIVMACLGAQAGRITIINRSVDRLRQFEQDLRQGAPAGLERLRFAPLADAPDDADEAALLINATSLGLKADDPSPIAPELLQPKRMVYDTTYGVRNRLAVDCAAVGTRYADGVSMLVWQGARSLEIWTGKPVPAESMRRAVEDELRRRKTNG